MSDKIHQWSYSRLATFEKCPKKAHFAYVKRIKEPGNKAMDRGKDIHTMCEDYIRGRYETIPKELADFEEAFDVLKDLHLKGYVTCEGDWAFDKDWKPAPWFGDTTWGRAKVDTFVYIDGQPNARVIDFKTGRYDGNQEVHREQCELYGAVVLERMPEVKTISTELWYLDHGKIDRYEYSADNIVYKKEKLNTRAVAMTEDTEFPAKPSTMGCKWCYFGKEKMCSDRYE